jgi:hypothetical protein
MPCCTEDNVHSFSCEPFGIIVEATCPDDPPPLPTTTTTTSTTEDPLLTTTTTAGPTTTPTPPIPYSVAWCTSRFCGNPCCENNTDKSYIYGPSDCQQFSNQEDALRFQEDLTDYISIEFQGTCSDIVTDFCFRCNNSCCPQTTTTTSEPTTTTTTTQDPSFGACILCNDGEIICTDEVTSSTCDFFADIINANWSQFYPNESCSDHSEVGDDCSGFTTTTTTEAPTTTTTTEDPLLTTTSEPTTTFPPQAYRCVECLDPIFCIDKAIRLEPCEGDFIYIPRGCTGPITYNPEQDCPNGGWLDILCPTTEFAPCAGCGCSGDGGGGDGGGGDDTTVNPFDPTSQEFEQ